MAKLGDAFSDEQRRESVRRQLQPAAEVVCERGQLFKVSKDKDGVVSRERLTRHWTDWVDYWAVDFDYMARKEIIKVPRDMGIEGHLPGIDPVQRSLVEYEERWTGGTSSKTSGRASARARTASSS
jgi:hypothetical protein